MILTKQIVSKDLASAAASEVTAKSALAPGGLFWNSQCGRKNQIKSHSTTDILCKFVVDGVGPKKSFRLKEKAKTFKLAWRSALLKAVLIPSSERKWLSLTAFDLDRDEMK